MTLTPEQQAAVTTWVAAGDSLSAVQKKLREQFDVSLTYMDVRFLVDDLNLALKDPAPKPAASDVTKAPTAPPRPAPPEKKGFIEKAKEKLGLGGSEATAHPDAAAEDDLTQAPFTDDDLPLGGASTVQVAVDSVTLIPGAVASGTVTFSDGVTGKWIVDQYGRPGFTEVSQPNYRPNPADAQAFMQKLSAELQKKGF